MKRETRHNFTSVYSAKTARISRRILLPPASLLAPADFHSGSFDKLLLLRRLPVVDSDGLSDVEPQPNTSSSRLRAKTQGGCRFKAELVPSPHPSGPANLRHVAFSIY